MAILGLDFGTSAVKALLLGEDGAVLAVGSARCPVDAPGPGRAEADPAAWLEAARHATARAAAGASRREPVRAVGLAGQMHGVVLCDVDGAPVRAAILWPDRRAAPALGAWRALAPGRRAALGNPVVPGMAGPILAWLARHEPDVLERARWALQPKDWVRLALTGEVAAEPSDASATLLWDLRAEAWATDVAAAAGVEPALLAPVLASDAVAGTVTPAAAERLGLPPGVPVHAGAADAAAALLGAGVTVPGRRLLNVGTGAQLITVVAEPSAAAAPTTHRFRTAAASGWYAMGAVQNAGLALDWARETTRATWDDAEAEAFAREPGAADDPLFLPYLTGERTPLLDADARAAWLGLALEHDRGALLRAAHEGVAHALRHAREALVAEGGAGAGSLRLLGGGSLRPPYRQLLADVLDEPLELLDVADASALGAALLAGGARDDPLPVARVEPGPEAARRLAERHRRWRAASEALRAEALRAAPAAR